jgi:hypothetical protein
MQTAVLSSAAHDTYFCTAQKFSSALKSLEITNKASRLTRQLPRPVEPSLVFSHFSASED